MIVVTKLSGREVALNSDLIEIIETNPDTTVCMTNGKKYIVKDTRDEIVNKIIEFKRKIMNNI